MGAFAPHGPGICKSQCEPAYGNVAAPGIFLAVAMAA